MVESRSRDWRGLWRYVLPHWAWRMLPPLHDGETIVFDGVATWRRSWWRVSRGWLTLTENRLVYIGTGRSALNALAIGQRRDGLMASISVASITAARKRRTWTEPGGELEIVCSTGEIARRAHQSSPISAK